LDTFLRGVGNRAIITKPSSTSHGTSWGRERRSSSRKSGNREKKIAGGNFEWLKQVGLGRVDRKRGNRGGEGRKRGGVLASTIVKGEKVKKRKLNERGTRSGSCRLIKRAIVTLDLDEAGSGKRLTDSG